MHDGIKPGKLFEFKYILSVNMAGKKNNLYTRSRQWFPKKSEKV